MPQQLCWECAALVNKFHLFRRKCDRAYLLLQEIYSINRRITTEDIQKINRAENNLCSSYGCSKIFYFHSEHGDINEIKSERQKEEQSSDANVALICMPHKAEVAPVKDEQCVIKSEPQVENEWPLSYVETVSLKQETPPQKRIKKICRSAMDKVKRKCKKKMNRKRTEKEKPKKKLTGNFEATRISFSQEQMMHSVRDRQNGKGYRAAQFKCTLCFKGFMEQKTYSNHMRLHDPSSGDLECDICKVRLKSRLQAHCHISSTHMMQFQCRLCSSVTSNKAAAKKHYDWHRGVTYTCDICGYISSKLTTHLSHVRIKHPSQHICGDCGESFVSPRGLYDHTKKMHAQNASAGAGSGASGAYCGACDVRFSSERVRTRHILISPRHERERAAIPHGCRDCGECFPEAGKLAEHVRAQHPPRLAAPPPDADKPVCVQCGAVQASPRAYWAHFRRAHPGETYPLEAPMPFICELCGKGFKCNSLLTSHLNIHTGTRNHKCSVCPKSFYKPECLRAHLASHSDSRPHICELCNKGFKLKWALQRHMRYHEGSGRETSLQKDAPERTGRAFDVQQIN